MYNELESEVVMKDNIVILIAILIVAGLCFFKPENRYEVVTGANMLTILVDKQTGETWRNCICGDKSNVPGCWEKMITINPESFNKPKGEAKAFNKMVKLQKKLNKNQPQPVEK